ncbi:helix-turn-helix transcriptional regulator [Candidatus Bathyarchaeota archaeon]|nr:helix-turn-helix transcriptional regulator [Candidatus Bathyarchaeota archaeon]MBT4321372.1 helix-turn-helix transcriptional regulator [Candidatus Bathyarchaeota archaeon]MBT4422987.1 helix-turn-helix transcriptional regulator [Candidatus Bathyarchaeota archaeon]MBT6603731.1 helix-turn-helix transcriptional regulator [Candidatus Bathyarchaeota archaeon]MBT7346989.1 helix-turn-helix transcriptional regulator [Candidatus Bathyarchaeota archaeon]
MSTMSLSINSKSPIKMPVSPLQILLLTQLEEGSKYGYEMLKQLKDEFEGTWTPKTGTVYPALKSLQKKGFVDTLDKDGTDFYHITEDGKAIFELMESHVLESVDFSVKYVSVIFNWLSTERKQGAIELMNKLAQKEQFLSQSVLRSFTESIDTDIREPFLRQIKDMAEKRLVAINALLEDY